MPYTFEIVGKESGVKHAEVVTGTQAPDAVTAVIATYEAIDSMLQRLGTAEQLKIVPVETINPDRK